MNTAMKPILFNTPMVKAILDGRKSQTRRILKSSVAPILYKDTIPLPSTIEMSESGLMTFQWSGDTIGGFELKPPYHPGDVLWVRETWKQATTRTAVPGYTDCFLYRADEPQDTTGMIVEDHWHPSIHMPRRAARLFLRVTRIWAERLQSITKEGIEAEGTDLDGWYDYDEWQHQVGDGCVADGIPVVFETMRGFFGHTVWDSTMHSLEQFEEYGWDANPWVWVIEFERRD